MVERVQNVESAGRELPTWYTMDTNLRIVEQEPVTLVRALEIVDDYFSRVQSRYESGEEAITATMFGFSRSDRDFIEICVHDTGCASCHVEGPQVSGSIWRRLFQSRNRDEEIIGRAEIIDRVTAYFTGK
jgi:hypothetical protein